MRGIVQHNLKLLHNITATIREKGYPISVIDLPCQLAL